MELSDTLNITISISSIIIAIIGTAIAVYSFRKQKNMEVRLRKKEELKELTEKLKSTISNISHFVEILRDSSAHPDNEVYALLVAKDVLSKTFDEKVSSAMIECYLRISGEEGMIEISDSMNEKKIFETISRADHISIGFCLEGSEASYGFYETETALWRCLHNFKELYRFEDIIEEFAPGLFTEFKDIFKKTSSLLILNIRQSAKFEVAPEDFTETKDIADWIFHRIHGYEYLKSYLEKLERTNEKLKELRKNLLMTCYS